MEPSGFIGLRQSTGWRQVNREGGLRSWRRVPVDGIEASCDWFCRYMANTDLPRLRSLIGSPGWDLSDFMPDRPTVLPPEMVPSEPDGRWCGSPKSLSQTLCGEQPRIPRRSYDVLQMWQNRCQKVALRQHSRRKLDKIMKKSTPIKQMVRLETLHYSQSTQDWVMMTLPGNYTDFCHVRREYPGSEMNDEDWQLGWWDTKEDDICKVLCLMKWNSIMKKHCERLLTRHSKDLLMSMSEYFQKSKGRRSGHVANAVSEFVIGCASSKTSSESRRKELRKKCLCLKGSLVKHTSKSNRRPATKA